MPTPEEKSISLKEVKTQFVQWRAIRVKGNRIPHALWEAVKHLATRHSLNQIAHELGLNLQHLRTKLKTDIEERGSPLPATSDFIRVSLPPVSSSIPQPPSLEQKILFPHIGTLELTRPDGSSLKATGLAHKELLSFVERFLDS